MIVVVARSTFMATGQRLVSRGELVDDTDPLVKGNPDLFETVEQVAARPRRTVIEGTKPPVDVGPVDVDNADKPKASRTRKA